MFQLGPPSPWHVKPLFWAEGALVWWVLCLFETLPRPLRKYCRFHTIFWNFCVLLASPALQSSDDFTTQISGSVCRESCKEQSSGARRARWMSSWTEWYQRQLGQSSYLRREPFQGLCSCCCLLITSTEFSLSGLNVRDFSCIPLPFGLLDFTSPLAEYKRLQTGGQQVAFPGCVLFGLHNVSLKVSLRCQCFYTEKIGINKWFVKLLVHGQHRAWILIVCLTSLSFDQPESKRSCPLPRVKHVSVFQNVLSPDPGDSVSYVTCWAL